MKKKIVTIGIVFTVLVAVAFILRPMFAVVYWRFVDLTNISWRVELKDKYKNQSKEILLKKYIKGNSYEIPVIAEILIERKDLNVVSDLVMLLSKSKDIDFRAGIIDILAKRNDEGASDVLAKIVDKGNMEVNYINALYGLAYMKYEPAFIKVVELANSPVSSVLYEERAYSVGMLEKYGNDEAIKVLEQIAKNDPDWAIRENAKNAIGKIESSIKK